MISGTFHPIAQDWRYFSKEKSLAHTLHLAQLDAARAGETILVKPVQQVQNSKGFTNPPMPFPSGFYGGSANAVQVTNTSMVSDCYGATDCNGSVIVSSKMSIHVAAIGGALSQIMMTPQEAGFFVVHAECYSDIHHFGYEGVANDGQITLSIINGGSVVSQAVGKAKMEGPDWNPVHTDWFRRMQCSTECLVPNNGQFVAVAENLGAAGDCCLTMYAYKVADYP